MTGPYGDVDRAAAALAQVRRAQARERQVQAADRFANLYGGRAPVTPPSGLGRPTFEDVAGTGAPRERADDTGAHTRTFGWTPDAVPPPAPQSADQRPGFIPTREQVAARPSSPRPAPPSGVELAERLGQTYGTALSLRAQLRARSVECQRWATLLEHEEGQDLAPPTPLAREYAAEAQGLAWALAAVDRVILALDGERRPAVLDLPDALPGVLPPGVG